MTQTLKFKRVSVFRRICSIIFDGIICFSLMFIVASFVAEPIISACTDYQPLYQEYMDECVNSHLYNYYSENQAVSLISTDYDIKLTEFYNDNDLGYTIADYNQRKHDQSDQYVSDTGEKLETPLFLYDAVSDTYTENTEASSDDLTTFYSDLTKELATEFLKTDSMSKLSSRLSGYTVLFYLIGLIVSVLFTYLFFPMLFKDGTTIGKKIMQMRVISLKNGQNAGKLQLFLRFVYFCLTGVVLGIFSYGLTVLINILFIVVNKRHMTVHDYIAKTAVVCNDFASDSVPDNDLILITYEDGQPASEETASSDTAEETRDMTEKL